MRTITLKYAGDCRKCSASLQAGIIAAYEKRVGVFCLSCVPTESEEIRQYRQAAADCKADRLEEWAEKREKKAEAVFEHNRPITSDWAFITQPGHIPIRARIIAQEDRQYESLRKAHRMRERANSLRHVSVAGDAEASRQQKRELSDKLIFKGSRVYDNCFREGTVIGVYKRSYRIKFDSGGTYARDKSYVVPLDSK